MKGYSKILLGLIVPAMLALSSCTGHVRGATDASDWVAGMGSPFEETESETIIEPPSGSLPGNLEPAFSPSPSAGDESGGSYEKGRPANARTGGPGSRPRSVAVSAAAPPGPFCPLNQVYMPAWQCEALNRQLEAAETREVLVEAEQPMWRAEEAWVRARLRRPGTAAPEGIGARQGSAVETVKATQRMRARLTGAGFTIDPPGWVTEPTGLPREADWEWTVIPHRSGSGQKLTVSVQPVLAVGNETVEAGFLSQDIEVTVNVRPADALTDAGENVNRVSRTWAMALGGVLLLLAAAAGLWRWMRRGGRKDAVQKPR